MISYTALVLPFLLIGEVSAFSPNSMKPLAAISSTKTQLNSHAINSEDDAMYIMMKAEACAHSDTCSLEDAENYLDEVLHLQSNCVSGQLASHGVCDDIVFPSEVVASLRAKIAAEQGTGLRLNPVVISIAAAYLVAGTYSLLHHPQVDTFTAEEWMWGIRDGYFGQMLSTFMKHGGLPAVDPVQVVPFTPQEWWWSMRDGYVGDMIEQSWKNGGLVVSDSVEDLAPTTFLPEEWAWAVKDGYLSNMITHYFKHGGLS